MIILASNSWLRKEILDKSEFAYIAKQPDTDEGHLHTLLNNKTLEQQTRAIATAKARSINAATSDIIIAADTMAVLEGQKEPFHKPNNKNEAVQLALAQSGKTINIITGFCVKKGKEEHTGTSWTRITYTPFTENTIQKLLANDNPTIRNAGLGFFIDAPGFTLVESFQGSYTGGMGLPMELIRPLIVNMQ